MEEGWQQSVGEKEIMEIKQTMGYFDLKNKKFIFYIIKSIFMFRFFLCVRLFLFWKWFYKHLMILVSKDFLYSQYPKGIPSWHCL